MDNKRSSMIIALVGIFILIIQVQGISSEGSGPELTEAPISPPEEQVPNQTAIAQQNLTILSDSLSTSKTALEDIDVNIASDVYSDKDRQVLYCPQRGYLIVRNRIYLEGVDLVKVKQVKYILHESFEKPDGVYGDPGNGFEIWIWTWGSFLIKAVITTETGQTFEKEYPFSFKSKFEDAKSKGIPQIMRCEA